ncbi:NfeD family protein [Thermococcus sp.]|uniref:NfeD family protein n=1 Tax=Thermococcus sp. TaxID=35749 RepID=UPI0025D98AAA|nr:NfeD family protein [Thermococcus sp.]
MRPSRFLKLLVLAADEVIAGFFLLLVLPGFGVKVPLPIVAVVIGFLVLKDFIIAPFILKGGLEGRPHTEPESLLGREALVVEDLNPEGLVKVDGELWSAECINGTAKRNDVVRIKGVEGTKLLVERRE